MKFRLLFLLGCLLVFNPATYSQLRKITGKVTTANEEKGLANASVTVKGKSTGTVTNKEGIFFINISAEEKVLIFSYLGMKTMEVNVSNSTEINIVLVEEPVQLEALVVTALGIKKDRDKFASSASLVRGDVLARTGETGVLNGLSSKTAGINITRNGGDPGSGSYIQIRGQNTINGNAQPLFIIDGMPVSNSSDDIGAARSNGIIQQSRINDINPEDIESIEVLKGASAAALWGSRAANGVIIITTKKGKAGINKLNISYKSTVSFDKVNKKHPLQNRYGQGTNGLFIQGARSSFGDLISSRQGGMDTYITAPSATGYQGYVTLSDGSNRYAISSGTAANPHGGKNSTDTYNHNEDAFGLGYFFDNILNVSGGNEKSSFLISYGDLKQKGVVKGASDYNRKTARVNVSSKFTNWFTASANIGYTNINSARVQEGDNADGILLSSLRTPPDFNNSLYTGTFTNPLGQVFNNAHVSYRNPLGKDLSTIYPSPMWNIENNKNTSNVDRFIGSMQFDLKPLEWLIGTARFGIDNFTDSRTERFARNSANFANGFLSKNILSEKQFNTDLFLTANKLFSKNLELTLLTGFNYNSRRRTTLTSSISNFIIPTAPDILTNALNSNLSANNFNALARTYGFYAQADIAAFDMFYFTFTGRNESASTFGLKTKNSFFFPSAAMAWQFSKLEIFKNNPFFSFGKLRLTWGQVGIQPQPYQNFTNFRTAVFVDDFSNGLSGISALYGGGFIRNSTAGNEFLRPEIKTEVELGADLRFFNNKLSISATVYSNKTNGVILPINVPTPTGFTSVNSNAAALKNNGIEIEASSFVLNKGNFKWSINGNFSTNKNIVTSLAGATSYRLPDKFLEIAALVPGQPFGVFLSTDFLKDKGGNYVLDANGFPQAGTGLEVIGDPNPGWRAALGSTFFYKNLSLHVLFDRVAGNDFFNGTRGSLYSFGTHADVGNTAIPPSGGVKDVAGNIIPAGTAFQGQIKDFGAGPVALNQLWWQGRGSVSSTASYKQFVEDASVSRLREISLSYSVKKITLLKKVQLSGMEFSITGRNLVLWTKYSGTDPELNVTGAGLSRGQDWFTNPNTKSILLSILIKY